VKNLKKEMFVEGERGAEIPRFEKERGRGGKVVLREVLLLA